MVRITCGLKLDGSFRKTRPAYPDRLVGPEAEGGGRSTNHRRPCPASQEGTLALETPVCAPVGQRSEGLEVAGERLTKREKASLNSETCSSVRESACSGDDRGQLQCSVS